MGITSATRQKPSRKSTAQANRSQGTGRQRAATQGTDLQRERILQAAAQLFAAQGYANTTMAQIVRALGVTKPFVYYYFRDKQEIFETLSWRPTVDCFTALDFAADDPRRASEKVLEGIERLIRATIAHHPCAFFAYREPQVYRPEYVAAQKKLAHHFYGLLCPLLEEARRDGDLDFTETKITALAACSLPGFLYSWYRPDGRLSADEVVAELTKLASRVIGLRAKD
ncbi:AcrR family transcriptional regulator [Variovorax paradoxus]|jgi:AcrR family transcriptional regulator|uniref:TetR/AcrR family transcriptional regulator n=1 Tax=Variovorax paradoxus TaxID=34073 RepID=UPI0027946894|nr:TetR/AcrR family transcriptional regulator [Variovorax paradoxus]MDQ0573754.1 AcrR family transcriptional regulator [Variovorax paradoxus]